MLYLMTNNDRGAAQSLNKGSQSIKTASQVGGPFEMLDHNGELVSDKSYEGQYKMMFFGFTHCPGICPTELTKISAALDILEEKNMAENITPIFISIDPARDTPEVMKDYVAVYDKRLVGLTGSKEQVDVMKDNYKVHASKIEMEMMAPEEYMMDHSMFTYFMSPENELLLVFDVKDTAAQIAGEIESIM